ncbi:hypothetical protein GQ43DRAFT_376509 [Delitschia confertaspora ATCC 74209]|uniref:N-acetyltransferase domain-containing protein n=1 Tax=Delitschia confertaspora ATCC 74209 TaxID=1513339 RepID=A0A9P4JH56_9PLEO|nr:hypothetical protein GQ43DRAFT_376509 [Delitschia confertaspora ATCC 74209]
MSPEASFPAFDNVRLATTKDLARIATVAAAGFYWSPVFQFQRPYFADFPEDTFNSYFTEYESAIEDPGSVVIVSEDDVSEKDPDGLYEALRKVPSTYPRQDANGKIIVGVCSITLNSGSGRVGQFQPGGKHVRPHLTTGSSGVKMQQRDQHGCATEMYNKLSGPAKAKYLAGQMRLSTVAVHPTYWRRGHGSRLVNWCTRLADIDGVPVGVSAAPTGVAITVKAGFEEQERVWIADYKLKRKSANGGDQTEHDIPGLELWIGIRKPRHPQVRNVVQTDCPMNGVIPFWSPRPWVPQAEDLSL